MTGDQEIDTGVILALTSRSRASGRARSRHSTSSPTRYREGALISIESGTEVAIFNPEQYEEDIEHAAKNGA